MSFIKMLSILVVSVFVYLFVGCSTNASSTNPLETFREIFSVENETDLESKFIGKETQSNWKIETIGTKNIKVINDLFFVDDNYGWLVGAFGTIYKTENGGKDWKQINVEIPEKTVISKIVFANRNKGWMIVYKYNISILEAENNQFWVMKTDDGGENWKSTFIGKSSVFSEIKFADKNMGYITGYKYPDTKQTPIRAEGLFLQTQNSGETWTDLSKEFNDFKVIEDKKIQIQYTNDSADNIYFINPTHLRLVTHSRRVLETKDGGKTWSKLSQYAHDDQQVGIKNFGYKEDGIEWYLESTYSIEGVRARLKTKNSQNQISRRVIHGVFFTNAFYLSGGSFIAAGRMGNLGNDDKSVIWLTNDDGKTWSEIYQNANIKGIETMIQVSKDSFWALSENNEILHLSRK